MSYPPNADAPAEPARRRRAPLVITVVVAAALSVFGTLAYLHVTGPAPIREESLHDAVERVVTEQYGLTSIDDLSCGDIVVEKGSEAVCTLSTTRIVTLGEPPVTETLTVTLTVLNDSGQVRVGRLLDEDQGPVDLVPEVPGI